MVRRIVGASTLIVVLLVVLPAAASTAQTERSATLTGLQPGRPGVVIQPSPDPGTMPNNGAEPGDDDTPNRGGGGGVNTPSRGTVSAADGRNFWIIKDLSAWLQRHLLVVLRAER